MIQGAGILHPQHIGDHERLQFIEHCQALGGKGVKIVCLSHGIAQQIGIVVQGLPVPLQQRIGLLLETWVGDGFGGQTGKFGTPCFSQPGELLFGKDQLW